LHPAGLGFSPRASIADEMCLSPRTIDTYRDNLFKKLYNQNLYKDEFGLPSTHKEWTPEPLIKQMVLEATGNRAKAQQTPVINLAYEERDSVKTEAGSIVIDVEKVLVD